MHVEIVEWYNLPEPMKSKNSIEMENLTEMIYWSLDESHPNGVAKEA